MPRSALVCLHGLGRSAADWDGVREALRQLGPVVTPELPRDAAGAHQVAADALPRGAVLVGHSFGALIALRLAAQPERAVRGVVLSSAFFPPARNGRTWGATLADYAGHRIAFVRGRRAPDRVAAGARGGATRGLGHLAGTALRTSAFRATAEAVSAPVLVVHASDDHYVPLDFALAAVSARSGWELALLDRGGHHPHVTRPAAWSAVVDPWLRELPGR